MKIDNTMFSMYMKCPQMYWERYEAPQDDVQRRENGEGLLRIQGPESPGRSVASGDLGFERRGQPVEVRSDARGIELDAESEGRDFGTRMHQLLHERRLVQLGFRAVGAEIQKHSGVSETTAKSYCPAPEWPDESIESECQATLAAYEAHYVRDYDCLESERTSVISVARNCPECGGEGQEKLSLPPGQRICQVCGQQFSIHELVVKLDAVVRHSDGTIGPFDTKTESRTGYNTREDWAGKTQAKIYLYALERLYPHERVSRLVVDVVSRGSPKARRGPLFYRIDDIGCSPEALQEAIRNVMWVADDIERSRKSGWWRSNMNVCKRGWEKCDFYPLHVIGRTAENLRKYRPAEQYLDT